MSRIRRTEITIETRKLTLIHAGRGAATRVWCDGCAAEADMLPPEQAARLAGADTRALYRQIEAGRLHFAELADGGILICLPSLLTAQPKEKSQ